MRRLPPLNALKAFEATARLSSITGAAEELNISHSSVSQHIKVLEDYFGQKLFIRQGRGIEPTRAAQAYMEEIRAGFDRISVASEQMFRRGKQRVVTLNATPSFALRWLIPKTAEFQLAHPNIDLQITTSTADEIGQLQAPYDFIFRRDTMTRPGYVCRRILDDRQTPVLAPDLYQRFTIETPKDLAGLTILHMRSRPDAWTTWFRQQGVEAVETIAGPFFDHFFLSLQAAINGHGVAIGSEILIEDDLTTGRLMTPFPELTLEGPGFHVLFHPEQVDNTAARQFLEWLSQITATAL